VGIDTGAHQGLDRGKLAGDPPRGIGDDSGGGDNP
jgi:hypothetical protein